MIDKQPLIKKGWLRAVLIIFPFLIVMSIFQLIGAILIAVSKGESIFELSNANFFENTTLFESLIIQFWGLIGTLVIVFVFRKFIDRKPFFSLGFDWKGRAKDFLWGFIVAACVLGIGTLVLYFLDFYNIQHFKLDFSGFFLGFLLFVTVSFNEEIFSRGYFLQNMMDSFNKFLALAISASLFAVLHIFNPNVSVLSIVNIFLAGLLLGASYIYTKNLWFPISLHLFWNFIQGPVLGYEVSGQKMDVMIQQSEMTDNLFTGGEFGFEGSALCSILLVIFIAGIILYYERKKNNS